MGTGSADPEGVARGNSVMGSHVVSISGSEGAKSSSSSSSGP